MAIRVFSAAIQGIDAQLVDVEIDSTPGLHLFNIVGLPDKAVEESKDRIGSALRNTGFTAPSAKNKRFLINLAPADLKKEGPAYDLPIAVAYLLETKQISSVSPKTFLAGELSLDGSLKHTSGILAMTLLAKAKGFEEIVIPLANIREGRVVQGIRVIGAQTIKDVANHLQGSVLIPASEPDNESEAKTQENSDSLRYIKGQESAKRALAIAAAGGHNIIMNGAPGSGKTLLAKAFSELLPPLTFDEAIEVAKIYSALGLIKDTPLSFRRPFRNPHHTTSSVAMVGGGSWPKPGEISLAHRGVLFMDELPEFRRDVLEALRQPLEDGVVTISRAAGSVHLPAKFTLVAAMNPCPCGNYGDERTICYCAPANVLRYRKKVSGPLLDRMDIQVSVPREIVGEKKETPEESKHVEDMKRQVLAARATQGKRLKSHNISTNAEITHKTIDALCVLAPSAEKLLQKAVNAKRLSMRAYHKIKKLARTIADLEATDVIQDHHIAEAIALRFNEKMVSELA